MAEPERYPEEGARLRQWRQERGLPRTAVARALGVTERTVVRWELGTGKPRMGDWDRLRALWPEAVAS